MDLLLRPEITRAEVALTLFPQLLSADGITAVWVCHWLQTIQPVVFCEKLFMGKVLIK